MLKEDQNRREHQRVYFTPEQVFEATVSLANAPTKEFRVKILNLSEGGLFFINDKNTDLSINPGETLFLSSIGGPCPVNFPRKILLEIKWVSSDLGLEFSGYGCEFIDLPLTKVRMMRDIVTHYLDHDKNQ